MSYYQSNHILLNQAKEQILKEFDQSPLRKKISLQINSNFSLTKQIKKNWNYIQKRTLTGTVYLKDDEDQQQILRIQDKFHNQKNHFLANLKLNQIIENPNKFLSLFRLIPINNNKQTNAITTLDNKNSTTQLLIIYWKSTCEQSQKFILNLKQKLKMISKEGFLRICFISLDNQSENVVKVSEELEIHAYEHFRLNGWDSNHDALQFYQVQTIPHLIIVSSKKEEESFDQPNNNNDFTFNDDSNNVNSNDSQMKENINNENVSTKIDEGFTKGKEKRNNIRPEEESEQTSTKDKLNINPQKFDLILYSGNSLPQNFIEILQKNPQNSSSIDQTLINNKVEISSPTLLSQKNRFSKYKNFLRNFQKIMRENKLPLQELDGFFKFDLKTEKILTFNQSEKLFSNLIINFLLPDSQEKEVTAIIEFLKRFFKQDFDGVQFRKCNFTNHKRDFIENQNWLLNIAQNLCWSDFQLQVSVVYTYYLDIDPVQGTVAFKQAKKYTLFQHGKMSFDQKESQSIFDNLYGNYWLKYFQTEIRDYSSMLGIVDGGINFEKEIKEEEEKVEESQIPSDLSNNKKNKEDRNQSQEIAQIQKEKKTLKLKDVEEECIRIKNFLNKVAQSSQEEFFNKETIKNFLEISHSPVLKVKLVKHQYYNFEGKRLANTEKMPLYPDYPSLDLQVLDNDLSLLQKLKNEISKFEKLKKTENIIKTIDLHLGQACDICQSAIKPQDFHYFSYFTNTYLCLTCGDKRTNEEKEEKKEKKEKEISRFPSFSHPHNLILLNGNWNQKQLKNIQIFKLGNDIQPTQEEIEKMGISSSIKFACNGVCVGQKQGCRWVCLNCKPGSFDPESGLVDFCEECQRILMDQKHGDFKFIQESLECDSQCQHSEEHVMLQILFNYQQYFVY